MNVRRVWLCILFPLVALTVVCYSLQQHTPGEAVVRADAPVANAPAGVVEAENCNQEEGCQTEGFWKPWWDTGFSNEWLITNEHTETLGLPLPVTLTLEFTGTGVGIVYRQDTWYGTLGVEIDDQVEYWVSQQGALENQAETCFEVDGEDPHSLILSGGEATGVVTGVITVDAIKVFEGDEPCGTEGSLCNRGIIVPAYFYPDLPDGYWGQLVEAAGKIDGKLTAIANVYNGPGAESDRNYSEAINAVIDNGGKVIGYVHTCYGEPDPIHSLCPKTIEEIKSDVDRWYQFYPAIDGIFFDEVSFKQEKVPFYQELYDYVQGKQSDAVVVNNFGVKPHENYLGVGSSILCTFESPFSNFVGWLPPNWVTRERSCVLVYDTSSSYFPAALERLSKMEIGWFYFTSDTNGVLNPWDTLPPYFRNLVNSVSCVYLPIVLKNHP